MKKKALYKTAMINSSEIEGYKLGEYVSVRFLGKGSFAPMFQISLAGRPTLAVAEHDLRDFVL